ncbi:MAG: hypothetical protein HRS57_02880 [Mycoplasmataceae bacterium]|nr:hypothetical protein [Mycoplasmataceae bacterium]
MNSGPIRKGLEKDIINFKFQNLKEFGLGKHKKVDETPYGGGAGMLLMVEPIHKAIDSLKTKNSKVVIFTPEGKKFKQSDVKELSKLDEIEISKPDMPCAWVNFSGELVAMIFPSSISFLDFIFFVFWEREKKKEK